MTGPGGPPFGGHYVDYWKARVETAPDQTRVPGAASLLAVLPHFPVDPGHRLLDLGCGFGRFFPILSRLTPLLTGMDLAPGMLNQASGLGYACLVEGRVERTGLPDGFMDRIVCWATFDAADQEQGLVELHRVLRPGGLLLLTGKNQDYREDDAAAFLAERNARLKAFPNHFTDVPALLQDPAPFGFSVDHARGFERRGDFGEDRAFDLAARGPGPFYEFLLVLRKEGPGAPARPALASPFSAVARRRAREQGFGEDVPAFFQWHLHQFP